MERKFLWETYDENQLRNMNEVNERYKNCLNVGKTERECVTLATKMAQEAGYVDLKDVKEVKPGSKIYTAYNNKTIALFNIGTDPIEDGMNILGAHIDSPRLDIKQNPLYEAQGFSYLDTHYYGGIKKYQWVTIPLAIHGVIVKKMAQLSMSVLVKRKMIQSSQLLIYSCIQLTNRCKRQLMS